MRLIAVVLLLGAATVEAQNPPDVAPSPKVESSPSPSPPPAALPSPVPPSPVPPAPPAAPAPRPGKEPDEVRIRADTQGGEKGHYFFQGFVDLRRGDIRIQADRLDLYELERSEGGQERKIVAEGNVVFLRGEERLSGERLTMDVDTGQGVFEQALGYVSPGVFVEAKTIERIEPNKYLIEGAKFTSCAQPNPRWGFTASSATVEVDQKIIAKNALFKIKDVPTLYLPYLWYPIREDNRSTGFLTPHAGYSSTRGFILGEGFFWAMGRSYDQTFYADHYSTFGNGFGHEFRYLLSPPSNGFFKTYVLKPVGGGPLDFDLNWAAVQALPLGFQANLQVRRYSNLAFQQRIQDALNLATTRTERSSLSVQNAFGNTHLRIFADSVDTFFTTDQGTNSRQNRHLPDVSLSRSSQKIAHTPIVWGYEAHFDELQIGDQTQTNKYSRLDAYPYLSVPLAVSFFRVTPHVLVHYTRYGRTQDQNGNYIDVPLAREFFESTLEIGGPYFSRIFTNPSGLYSERFKHSIGPEITYRYRTAIDHFGTIPKFDGTDQYLGTNQIEYAIVQSFLAKRPNPAGKLVPYEFFSWRLGQTYYVQIRDKQNEFDPNYSSSAFGPGGIPQHNSPLQSQMRFRPTRLLTANFNLEYDVNFKQLRTLNFNSSIAGGLGTLQLGWARAEKLAVDAANRAQTLNTVRGTGTLNVIPRALTLDASAVYDTLNHNMIQLMGRARYAVQCCGVNFEFIQYQFNARNDQVFRFSFDLANIGSVGSFFGQDPNKLYGGSGAYR
jgi:LPS-assembly protein